MMYMTKCEEISGTGCTIAISADDRDVVRDAAVTHVVTAHGQKDSDELRRHISTAIYEREQESPPVS